MDQVQRFGSEEHWEPVEVDVSRANCLIMNVNDERNLYVALAAQVLEM